MTAVYGQILPSEGGDLERMSKIVMTPDRWRELLEIIIKVAQAIRDHLRGRKRGRKRRRRKKQK